MAFAPRPRTPTASKVATGNGTIQRLLEIVNQHGLQLELLREEQEALRQETEALREALKAKPKDPKAGAPKIEAKCKASPKGPVPQRQPVPETRRISVCSTSSGSEAGGTSTCSRRSNPPKVADIRSSDPATSAPRSVQRSSSAPTTPRGASAQRASTPRASTPRASTPRATTPRRCSGEEGRSSTPRKTRAKLFEVAQPLLQAGTSKEKRVVALSALRRCLQDGASPFHWDGPLSPLRSAVQAQDIDMARLLIQARADPNERDAKGVSVLHTASFDGISDLCQTLLKARADANAADQHGQTAFFFAPSSAVCEVLLENKADVNAVNQKGQSALHLASRAGLTEVLLWMAQKVSPEVMERRDVHGATAAYYARHAGVSCDFLRHKSREAEPDNAENSDKPSRHEETQARRVPAGSWPSKTPLAPVLEDQLDGEEEEPKVQDSSALDLEEEPELPGSSTQEPLEAPGVEVAQDMEVTSCFFEDCPDSPVFGAPKDLPDSPVSFVQDAQLQDAQPMEAEAEEASPTSSLDRADQMVTWEEDCGCPGFALTGSTAPGLSDSPEAAQSCDGNSVASDISDSASPGKARSKRRTSLSQAFLRPLDPLHGVPPEAGSGGEVK